MPIPLHFDPNNGPERTWKDLKHRITRNGGKDYQFVMGMRSDGVVFAEPCHFGFKPERRDMELVLETYRNCDCQVGKPCNLHPAEVTD